jgi:hypothetical protein
MTEATLKLCRDYLALEQRIDDCQDLEVAIRLCHESATLSAQLNALFETNLGIKAMKERCKAILDNCERLQSRAAGNTEPTT